MVFKLYYLIILFMQIDNLFNKRAVIKFISPAPVIRQHMTQAFHSSIPVNNHIIIHADIIVIPCIMATGYFTNGHIIRIEQEFNDILHSVKNLRLFLCEIIFYAYDPDASDIQKILLVRIFFLPVNIVPFLSKHIDRLIDKLCMSSSS